MTDSVTGVTSSWASCGIGAPKGTRRRDDDAVPETSSGSTSLLPVSLFFCQPQKNKATQEAQAAVAGTVRTMSRSVRVRDPPRRTKFPRTSYGARLKALPVVSAKQERTSGCLTGANVHPHRKRRVSHAVMVI